MAMQNVCGGSCTPEIQTMYFQNHPANEGTGQNLPANEATCHPLVNVNKPEKIMAFRKRRHCRSMVHYGPYALEMTNLNAVASNLLMTRFKS